MITGASSGLGKEFAIQISQRLRRLDAVWLIARNTEKLEQVGKEIQRNRKLPVEIFGLDLCRKSSFRKLEMKLDRDRPDIRVLVNAAGFGKYGCVGNIPASVQEKMIRLNCTALTKMTAMCLPYCSKGSRIIQMASAAAFAPQPGFAVYSATKSYVLSLSEALDREVRGRGISVTAVCPGPVDTDFFKTAGTFCSPARKRFMARPEPVVRQALADAGKRKNLSVYGTAMKSVKIAARFLPHKLTANIMWMMNKQNAQTSNRGKEGKDYEDRKRNSGIH